MSEMATLLLVLATADNLVLDRGVGAYTVEAGSHHVSLAMTLALLTGVILLLGTLLALPLLSLFDRQWLALILLPLLALLATTIAGSIRLPSPWDVRVQTLVPLALCNALLLAIVYGDTTEEALPLLASALGTGLGLALLLLVCTHLRARLQDAPEPFRGTPIYLITLGIIGMSMQAFA